MRDFEKMVTSGKDRVQKHPRYSVRIDEIVNEMEKVNDIEALYQALQRFYYAGYEAGCRATKAHS